MAYDIELGGDICATEDRDIHALFGSDIVGVDMELWLDETDIMGRVWGCVGKGCGGSLYGQALEIVGN